MLIRAALPNESDFSAGGYYVFRQFNICTEAYLKKYCLVHVRQHYFCKTECFPLYCLTTLFIYWCF